MSLADCTTRQQVMQHIDRELWLEVLEKQIDGGSLIQVIEDIRYVCREKREHLQSAWQDAASAGAWEDAAVALGTAMDRIEV